MKANPSVLSISLIVTAIAYVLPLGASGRMSHANFLSNIRSQRVSLSANPRQNAQSRRVPPSNYALHKARPTISGQWLKGRLLNHSPVVFSEAITKGPIRFYGGESQAARWALPLDQRAKVSLPRPIP